MISNTEQPEDAKLPAESTDGHAETRAENQPDRKDRKLPETGKQSPDGTQQESTQQTEHGGYKGLEPTRYGDWEQNSRCTDF